MAEADGAVTEQAMDQRADGAEQAHWAEAAEEAEPTAVPPPDTALEQELLVITGMSGAGRSTAAHVMEDLGWYVVDNLPPLLMASLAELTGRKATGASVEAEYHAARLEALRADAEVVREVVKWKRADVAARQAMGLLCPPEEAPVCR